MKLTEMLHFIEAMCEHLLFKLANNPALMSMNAIEVQFR